MKKSARPKSRTSFLLLPIFIILAAAAWFLYPQINASHFGKFDRFNVVIGGSQIALISLNISEKSMVVVKLPPDLYLPNVVHGYGQYKAESVYGAGNLDHRGGETLSGSIEDYLGVPVDGYFFSPKKFSDPKNFFFSPDFLLKNTSNLTFIDKVSFLINLFKIRFDKVKTVDLSDYASDLVLADGSRAMTLEGAEVDQTLSGLLTEARPQAENFRVEVINTTTMAGLGARAVRLLSNIGLSVINVETQDLASAQCEILVTKNAVKSITVARIAQIYSCKISQKPTEDRAAITVKLGQNYADFLTK